MENWIAPGTSPSTMRVPRPWILLLFLPPPGSPPDCMHLLCTRFHLALLAVVGVQARSRASLGRDEGAGGGDLRTLGGDQGRYPECFNVGGVLCDLSLGSF